MQDLLAHAELLVERDGGIVAIIGLHIDHPGAALCGYRPQMLDQGRWRCPDADGSRPRRGRRCRFRCAPARTWEARTRPARRRLPPPSERRASTHGRGTAGRAGSRRRGAPHSFRGLRTPRRTPHSACASAGVRPGRSDGFQVRHPCGAVYIATRRLASPARAGCYSRAMISSPPTTRRRPRSPALRRARKRGRRLMEARP